MIFLGKRKITNLDYLANISLTQENSLFHGSQNLKITNTSLIIFRFQWLMAFVTLKFTNNLNNAIKVSGGYYFFGSVCFVSIAFIIYFAPETKGKTNDQMKEMFMKTRQIHGQMTQIGAENNEQFV